MPRILIAGCGDVGGALGVRLLDDGHEVFGLRRNVGKLPQGLKPVAADLTMPEALHESLPGDVDMLVYTAAASGFDDEAYRRAYVAGLGNVLGAMDRGRLSVRVDFFRRRA